jgi:type I restriction-modification system DNA methylase subunit
MTPTFEEAFAQVRQLAADFDAGKAVYLSADYTEARVRQDFLDKFFTALGWDVAHNFQKNPSAQEVKVEPSVKGKDKEGSSHGRADYAFHVAPNFRDARFFVEAKKPHGDIATKSNYLQTIGYGLSGSTPLAVLTDFEQFQILDCRYKPDLANPLNHCIQKFHYRDYADKEKFAFIFNLFSREAVASGSIETFARTLPKKRGKAGRRGWFAGDRQNVGDAFLADLDEYRDTLAHAFKNRNPNLDGETLTEITQRTLDRLVFIRFLEDKLIHPENLVAHFGGKATAWRDFVAACRKLDGIYNGIVFKEHALLDQPGFKVDDNAFADICQKLSPDGNVYNFNYLPIETLGSIYERFLGKVIVATDRRARVEEKPEVRKAGGVHYTPQYIARYLVENTVGKLIAGKTPAQIAKLRFLDISCGSGSILLAAYDRLLVYHRDWFNAHPVEAKKAGGGQREDGAWQLSLKQRREILVNNIYGVDIDRQAVEVCQLSLYLKLLEEETTVTAQGYQMEFRETLLPSLVKNIVCGNSLIGTDISSGELFERTEEKKLNPMNFEDRFPHILRRKSSSAELRETPAAPFDYTMPGVPLHGAYSYKKSKGVKTAAPPAIQGSEFEGGFDAIIGNPPYVRPHNLSDETKRYFWQHYRTFTHKSDLYCCFIENAARLLKPGGLFSYIVSHGWLRLNSFQQLRRFVLENFRILQLVELPYNVFAEAQVSTGIFVFEKGTADRKHKLRVIRATPNSNGASFADVREIPQRTFHETFQNVFDPSISPETEAIKEKMRRGISIGVNFEICFGLKTGDDEKFLHHTKGLHAEDKPLLRGDDVKRYATHYKGEYVWYVPKRMRAHRPTARPGEPRRFEQPKVLVKDTSSDFACTYELGKFYVKDVLIVIPKEGFAPSCDLRFVAGVINSKALRFYYRTTFQTIHVQNEELASLPLPKIDFFSPVDKSRHDRLVGLVEQMLTAQKQLAAARNDGDKDFYGNKCAGLDRQIDALVYELYGLIDDEVEIVEESAK